MNYKVILPYVLSVILIVISIVLFVDNNKLRSSLEQSQEKYAALKNNTKTQVQNDAKDFLKAFYNYEGFQKKEQIEGFATEDLQNTLFQTYDLMGEKDIDANIDYKSEIGNIYIYHAQDQYDAEEKANVLARFDSTVTLNGNKNKSVVFAELTLSKVKDKWLATKYKILKGVDEFEGN